MKFLRWSTLSWFVYAWIVANGFPIFQHVDGEHVYRIDLDFVGGEQPGGGWCHNGVI